MDRFPSKGLKLWMVLCSLLLAWAGLAIVAGESAPSEPGKTYKAKCVLCHGAEGSGQTAIGKKQNVRDLRSAEVQKQSDAQLYEIIARGKGKFMPGYEKTLGKEKVQQLVTYVRSLGKNR